MYNFFLEWPGHRVIVLDTRTHRGYSASDLRHAELLSITALREQVTNLLVPHPNNLMTIMVSPAPVLGLRLMEEFVQPILELKSVFFADAEAWGLNQIGFQRFLRALTAVSPLVLLSGDVHYGMSVRCHFWEDAIRPPSQAIFAQLTSSALKNEAIITYIPHMLGENILGDTEFFGWNNTGGNLRVLSAKGVSLSRTAKPLVMPKQEFLAAETEADWRYRLEFMTDTERQGILTTPPPLTTKPSATDRRGALGVYHQISQFVQNLLSLKAYGRQCVGVNNIGEIKFEGSLSSTTFLKVHHRLWWRVPGEAPQPLTHHVIDLTQAGTKPTMERL
jgi:hypothetical protein